MLSFMRLSSSALRSFSLVVIPVLLMTLVPKPAATEFTVSPVPTISGSAVIGSLLTAQIGTWSPTPDQVDIQWNRDGRPISGANGVSYLLTDVDISAPITVTVSASLYSEAFPYGGTLESRVSAPTPRVEPQFPFDPAFSDVNRGTPFYYEITWASYFGIARGVLSINGLGAQWLFQPVQPVNRDAMAAFLYRLAGSPAFTPAATSPFIDVPTTNQFYKEISWLAEEGISKGWPIGGGAREFRPLQPVARDAMAAFLFRFSRASTVGPPSESPFADVPIDSQFIEEIAWLAETGISTGWDTGNGTRVFRPLQPVNRDAMAAFMYRSGLLRR